MRNLALGITLSLVVAAGAAGQTFSGYIILNDPEIFVFESGYAGQYEATLTWGDSADVLLLAVLCNNEQAEPQVLGVSGGFRDRVTRLNLGIMGGRQCFVGVTLVDLYIADYTLNFQATTAGPEDLVELREADAEDHPEVASALAALQDDFSALRDAAELVAPAPKAGGPTRSYLAQIRPGEPQAYVVDAVDDVLELTAMWNRVDTDLKVETKCELDDAELAMGVSESGQERFLRFDADVLKGTVCTVTLSSPNTMVYALNVAFYGCKTPGDDNDDSCTPSYQCCKICTDGKACGDTCIASHYICRQPPGCACNDWEVCP